MCAIEYLNTCSNENKINVFTDAYMYRTFNFVGVLSHIKKRKNKINKKISKYMKVEQM